MSKVDQVAAEILEEQEWTPEAAALHDQILRTFQRKLEELAATDPQALTKAIAIVVPTGPGKEVFVLSDPATSDIAAELRIYAQRGEASPLAELAAARIRM